jgi:hypothetical protein
MRSKQKRNLLLVVTVLCVAIAVFAGLFYIPLGTCVRVFASTTPSGVSINGCSLRTAYVLSFSSSEISTSVGDRVIAMKVFSGQTELFTVEKTKISNDIGNYNIDSPTLPSDLSANSELRVAIELRDSAGNLLAQDETTILYK